MDIRNGIPIHFSSMDNFLQNIVVKIRPQLCDFLDKIGIVQNLKKNNHFTEMLYMYNCMNETKYELKGEILDTKLVHIGSFLYRSIIYQIYHCTRMQHILKLKYEQK